MRHNEPCRHNFLAYNRLYARICGLLFFSMKPITMKFKLSGGEGSIIPRGVIEDLLINVRDGSATFHFNDAKTTKALAQGQIKDGVESQYIERMQTTICLYPNMSQEQIVNHISNRLKEMEKKK